MYIVIISSTETFMIHPEATEMKARERAKSASAHSNTQSIIIYGPGTGGADCEVIYHAARSRGELTTVRGGRE